jgi:hypothetical protein
MPKTGDKQTKLPVRVVTLSVVTLKQSMEISRRVTPSIVILELVIGGACWRTAEEEPSLEKRSG